ncbi:MAG: cell division protein FtsQ/DivIB [Chthoniobacterales bacterium]
MTPRRPNINRRSRTVRSKESHHLLEVKMRAEKVRRQRTRELHRALTKIIFVIVLAGASYLGGRLLIDKFFFKNPNYNVQHLEVSLDGVLTVPELKARTGLVEGINIFSLDLSSAEKILNDLPEVKKAHVERILPNTVQVSIERRVPILRLAGSLEESFIPGQSFVIDNEGVAMSPEKLDATLLELPLLEGVDTSKVHLGQPLQDENLPFILALWNAMNNTPGILLTPRLLDISRGYCAIVKDTNDTQFTFGPENFPAQMERLQKLQAHCQESGRQLATANLMLEHNTPVTFKINVDAVAKK